MRYNDLACLRWKLVEGDYAAHRLDFCMRWKMEFISIIMSVISPSITDVSEIISYPKTG